MPAFFVLPPKSAVSVALLGFLPTNHNILAIEQCFIARYGRHSLSKADIVDQRHISLATTFKPDERLMADLFGNAAKTDNYDASNIEVLELSLIHI